MAFVVDNAVNPQVFLSHSNNDKLMARHLAALLTERGARVWIDEAELKIGDSLFSIIAEAVEHVDYVVALLSRDSVKSKWVKRELALALSREIRGTRVIVVPVRIDRCRIPSTLRDKLWCDLSDVSRDWHEQFDRLAESLRLPEPHSASLSLRLPASQTIPYVMKDLRVVHDDCESPDSMILQDEFTNGIFLPCRQRALGRVLAEPIRRSEHHPGGRRGDVFTAALAGVYSEAVRVRSLLRCATRFPGFCARCYGVTLSGAEFPTVGARIGSDAARAITSSLAGMRDPSMILDILEGQPSDESALVSPVDGVVTFTRNEQGGFSFVVRDQSSHYRAMTRRTPIVNPDDTVWTGQVLTSGTVSATSMLAPFGTEFLRRRLLTELLTQFMRQGVRIDERHLELLVAAMTPFVLVVGGGDGSSEADRIVNTVIDGHRFLHLQEKMFARYADRKQLYLGKPIFLGLTDLCRMVKTKQVSTEVVIPGDIWS